MALSCQSRPACGQPKWAVPSQRVWWLLCVRGGWQVAGGRWRGGRRMGEDRGAGTTRELFCRTALVRLLWGFSPSSRREGLKTEAALTGVSNSGLWRPRGLSCPPHARTTGPAYRFAGSASLQKALRWGACPWGSSLSASARSRSLLCKGTRRGGERTLTLIFFQKKRGERHSRTPISLHPGPWISLRFKHTAFTYIPTEVTPRQWTAAALVYAFTLARAQPLASPEDTENNSHSVSRHCPAVFAGQPPWHP